MKKAPLLVLLAALALPPALADHAPTCGAADGTVVDGLAVWLRPGCLGVLAYVPNCESAIVLFHGQVLTVLGYADFCRAGVWLP